MLPITFTRLNSLASHSVFLSPAYHHTRKLRILFVFLQDHCTPLYIASVEGFNDVVKSLIAANADVNYVCKVRKSL